jgi:hypothetical protein
MCVVYVLYIRMIRMYEPVYVCVCVRMRKTLIYRQVVLTQHLNCRLGLYYSAFGLDLRFRVKIENLLSTVAGNY